MHTQPLYAIKAELFKALAHPARLQVLEVLAADPGLTAPVARLLEATGAEPSALSQHLAVLKRAGVVDSTRTGNVVDYRLTEPLVAELLVVARAFLLTRLAETATPAQLDAARHLPALPGATAGAVLDAAEALFEDASR
ncbi:metalloregulator ArsR/SmtB family transcription factor [Xylanimonas protaetiae]|uniref:ArsR/SmtB family transcription factor n=1 Tax=Xylanimonas protaetiae TaxID=2509457 RepID=UPI002683BDF2